ncbi:hypothetical protein VTJ49DRAFT_5549 [Mycothermus thermophilus]|uniref:Uncharacterized protein n=1 Tax=Humicola insolens TaxID=85995 RepID=A0ABR3V322_HUMIN
MDWASLCRPATLAVVGLAALGVVLICKAVYLAFFHPLAKYPGPWLAKFTNAYAAYHGWKGDIHLDMWRCHQKYGDHVRYGPNRLIFNTSAALRDIYSVGSVSKVIKATAYEPLVHRAPNTLTIRGGKEHARRRRIMAQGVSEKAQRGYEQRITGHIAKFCDALFGISEKAGSERWSEPKDMSKWCYYLSFDIMADVVFGAHYNLLQEERFRYVIECIDKSNTRMSCLIQWPEFARLKMDKYIFREAIAARNRFIKFVSRVVGDRLGKFKTAFPDKVTAGPPDVFANLAAAKDPETGEGFSLNEIAAESTTLIVAGADTSSVAFGAILFYLADNKEAYDKAAAEVRSKFRSRDDIVMGPTLASCTYLYACINEALRMSPPVGLALWREVVADTLLIDGQPIHRGTDVGVPLYSIHHDPKYYKNPFEYRPERWLEDDGTGSVERARSVFNPFSVGMRSCLGKSIATTEMVLTAATVLFTGDFKFADGEQALIGRGRPDGELGRHRPNEYQLWDHITGQKNGPVLQFMPRKMDLVDTN